MRPSSLLAVPALVALLAGCTGSSAPVPSSPTDRPVTPTATRAAADPGDVARAEAGRLLVLVTPPRGAVQSGHAPVQALEQPPQTTATEDIVDLTRWWTVPAPPGRVYDAYERMGLPTLVQNGSGSATGSDGSLRYLIFTTTPERGLDSEAVLLTVTSDGHGGTALRADAQVVWLPARSADEHVPSDIDRIDVSAYVGNPDGELLGQKTLTGPAAGRLARLINDLPTAARAEHSCGADSGYTLRVVAGPLTFVDDVACRDIVVTMDGRSLPVLAANGGFVHAVASSMGLPDYVKPGVHPTPHDR